MANTVSNITYANTFGDWVVTTNSLVKENNDLAANNYIKPTGTLFLSEPTLGLQVANNAIVGGQLQVQGIGSSAYIQNNARVDGQAYFTNTTLSITTSGQANIGGPLLALGSGTGLTVSNNAIVRGTLTVGGLETVGGTLTIAGATEVDNELLVTGNTVVNANITSHASVNVTDDVNAHNLNVTNMVNGYGLYINGDAEVTSNVAIDKNVTVKYNTITNKLQANTSVSTGLLNVSGSSYVNSLQSNTTINTDKLQSNSNINTASLSVTGNVYANRLIANSSVTMPSLAVNTLIDANNATAYLGSLQTQGQLSVGGNFVINGTTIYNTNTFTLSASSNNQISYFNVYRSGANASIRWNETSQIWDMLDVNNSTYYRILTDEYLNSSAILNNTTSVATSAAVYSSNTYNQNLTNTANTYNQNLTNTANTSMKAYVDSANTSMKSYVDTANTSLKSYVDATYSNASNLSTGTISASRLPTSGVTAGVYGGSSVVPVVTVDNTGRITNVANTNVAGVSNYTYNSGNNTFTLATSAGTVYNATINQVGDFVVSGNLTVNGATTTVYSKTIATGDSLIKLAANNTVNDVVDIGFYGASYTGGSVVYHGLIREGSAGSSAGNFYLFKNLSTDPTSNTVNYSGLTAAKLVADGSLITNISGSNITASSIPNSAMASATISGVSLGSNLNTLTLGNYLTGTSYNGSGAVTAAVDATSTNTASKVVARDGSGNFSAGTITATLSGNANTASYPASGGNFWTSTNLTNLNQLTNGPGYITSSANITGTSNNITAFTINQNLGTSNNVQFYSLGVGTAASGTPGEIRAVDNITAYYSSDRKFKENVTTIPDALSKVECIGGKLFDWTDDYVEKHGGADGYFLQKSDFGVIAQDVQQAFPQAVRTRPDGSLAVDYAKLSALAFAAIVELKAEIDLLKQK